MKRHLTRRHVFPAAAVVAGSILSACGGSGESVPSSAGDERPQSLDTQQVLVLAQVTSENTIPFQVDDGALVLHDTSETSEPISINAP